MLNNLIGIITFEAISPDHKKFMNILKESRIPSYDVYYQDGKIIGKIYSKDFSELKLIGTNCNSQISILEKKGAIFIVHKYKKRLGLILGFILSVIMIMHLSDTVTLIEIYGNEKIPEKEIISLLNDADITIGSTISKLNLREAERKIISSSDMISWVGIRSAGSIIQVEIREMDTSPQIVSKHIPCNIISTKDAQIVDIKNVYSGMLVQMINNGVKKGDLLISGTIDDGKGGVYFSHSIGEIIGRYEEKMSFTQTYFDNETIYSDPVVKKHFHFLGFKIPLYINKNKFENYEYNENITYFKLGDIQFPMGMIYSEYIPYTISPINYTPEQAQNILIEKIKLYEYNFFYNENITIIDKSVEFIETDTETKALIKYILEGNIGTSSEIIVK